MMNSLKKVVLAVVSIGALVLAACSTGPEMGDPEELTQAGMGMAGYKLGSGDEIKVTVYGEPELSGPFVVDGQGSISMSLIGQVEVVNLSLTEMSRVLETKLKDGWLKDPKVTAELVKGRPYYILGEVNRPGEYPFVSGLTMMNAIASAGDFTYRADRGRILVKSADSPNEREVVLTPTTTVRPGDTIRIRERFF
ncbi:MAG: polysaccharide export protein [Hyphomonadaceae bacterium]|nr:polysaccharide export protein [Hyphomonadaceae bacterium]